MTLKVREARLDELEMILTLTAEDSQHYFNEPEPERAPSTSASGTPPATWG
jgi:hypothetical protein